MEAVLFDWDGTIVDSLAAHAHAARLALLRTIGRTPQADEIERFLLAPDAALSGLDADAYYRTWQAMQPLYRSAQREVRTFSGIAEALEELAGLGLPLGVVTSKRRWAVEAEMRRLGLRQRFNVVVCREDTGRHKPDPEPLALALEKVGATRAAFVGDTVTDLMAARAAGVKAVGVAWGWDGSARLGRQYPDGLCGRVADLVDVTLRVLADANLSSGQERG